MITNYRDRQEPDRHTGQRRAIQPGELNRPPAAGKTDLAGARAGRSLCLLGDGDGAAAGGLGDRGQPWRGPGCGGRPGAGRLGGLRDGPLLAGRADRASAGHDGVGRAIAALAGDPERLSLTGQALPIATLATRYGIDVTS